MARYGHWLIEEAIPGGGIGPAEADRIEARHLADSLSLAVCWPQPVPPKALLDIGSGVGLPGIPLAILWPDTVVTLLDRSSRRMRLARRAGRVLGLSNVETVVGDVAKHGHRYPMVTMRAVYPPDEATRIGAGLVARPGVLAVALSTRNRPEIPSAATLDIIEVPSSVLDSPAWLLRMTLS